LKDVRVRIFTGTIGKERCGGLRLVTGKAKARREVNHFPKIGRCQVLIDEKSCSGKRRRATFASLEDD
jgi:hypothetical protein